MGAFIFVVLVITGLEFVLRLLSENINISVLVWASDFPYWTIILLEIAGIALGVIFRDERFIVQLALIVWPAFVVANLFLGWAVIMCFYYNCPGHGLEFFIVAAAFRFFGGLFIANTIALGIIHYTIEKIQERRSSL